jgi:hypothetical protein
LTPPSGLIGYQGGVKPPHSKALRAAVSEIQNPVRGTTQLRVPVFNPKSKIPHTALRY